MSYQKLVDFLDEHHVKYLSISHSPCFTAQEVAASAHISGKKIAKTVIVKIGDRLAMVVIPANEHVDFATLKQLTGENDVGLARESDFKEKFTGCETGAVPPFGNLFGVPVFLSSHLAQDKIIFNGGSHSELIQMSYQDFVNLVKPKMITMH